MTGRTAKANASAKLTAMTSPHVLIVGCGDLGAAIGQRMNAAGCRVTGLRRSDRALPNIATFQGDVGQSESLRGLVDLRPDILVYSVAADAQTDESYRRHYPDGLRNVLQALQSAPPRHVFFVSSTRVYGVDDGNWLDEATPALPANFGGERLLEAERLLEGISATVLRLSGIYGPGRTRMLKLARTPRQWPATNAWTNRIHRDDAAAFIAMLIGRVLKGETVQPCYVVTDNAPAPQHEVLNWIAHQFSIAEPLPTSPPIAGGKRLSNRLMRASGYELQYPDHKIGYADLIASEGDSHE
jgi:nucleoside-diphosphate-sugar epimerase